MFGSTFLGAVAAFLDDIEQRGLSDDILLVVVGEFGLGPVRLRVPIRFLVELLAAIPSIVYGLWGIFVLVSLLRGSDDSGVYLLLAGFGIARKNAAGRADLDHLRTQAPHFADPLAELLRAVGDARRRGVQ